MAKIEAPFTEEQVQKLSEYQKGPFHPFTCCGPEYIPECKRAAATLARIEGKQIEYNAENDGVLIPTTEGWICPCGKYKQNWCHDFMVNPQSI